jgi:hypothetical protein
MSDKPSTPRFEPLPQEKMNPEQLKVFTAAKSLGGPVYNPTGFDSIMLRNPGLQDAITAAVAKVYPMVAEHLGVPAANRPTVNPAYIELGILLLAEHWDFPAMFLSHGPMALKAGLTQDTVDALAKGHRPSHLKADEEAVYELVEGLVKKHKVSDAAFAKVRQHLSERDVIDLTTALGFYTNSLMIMKVADSQVH